MRLALAHLLALVAFLGGLYSCFAFILGYGGTSLLNFRFSHEAFGFALIYMMFIGPFALILMLLYFGLLRARKLAVTVLVILSIALGFAFTDYETFLAVAPFRQWMSRGNSHLWIGIVWAGVTATLAHHLAYGALRPRRTKEATSHG
jgi:hypothetical protein